MTTAELQSEVDKWIGNNGGYWEPFQILARLTEELGEVASALQRSHGLRPHETDVDLAGEVGDLLFTVAAFANVNRIDLAAALRTTLTKYDERDSKAWQQAGV